MCRGEGCVGRGEWEGGEWEWRGGVGGEGVWGEVGSVHVCAVIFVYICVWCMCVVFTHTCAHVLYMCETCNSLSGPLLS